MIPGDFDRGFSCICWGGFSFLVLILRIGQFPVGI